MYYIYIGVFKKLYVAVLSLLKILPFSLWNLLQSTRDLFLCSMWGRYAVYFFSCGMMIFLHHLLNCIFFLHVSSVPFCDKSPYMLRHISKHSLPFSWPISLSQCQYITDCYIFIKSVMSARQVLLPTCSFGASWLFLALYVST